MSKSKPTKKEARAAKAAYALALAEGRVVRLTWRDEFGREQITCTAHPTAAAARADLAFRSKFVGTTYTSAAIVEVR